MCFPSYPSAIRLRRSPFVWQRCRQSISPLLISAPTLPSAPALGRHLHLLPSRIEDLRTNWIQHRVRSFAEIEVPWR
jgi:hypothetical protein